MGGFARACGNCAMYVKGPDPRLGRGYKTGYCTHPAVGRVVRDDDHCIFFVKDGGRGFDENAALRAWERVNAGQDKNRIQGPRIVNLDQLRARNQRENEWHKNRKEKA